MAYGDKEGAIGYLVGEENRGLEYMFTMMNFARLEVGIEGVALAERAYQRALELCDASACKGAQIGVRGGERVTIIHHPDVRRMLMTMKAQVEAMRALAACRLQRRWTSRSSHPDRERASQASGRVRSADSGREGLVHRAVASRSPRSACKSTAAWASSRKPAPRSICAMRASPRSTKAPPAFRPTISIGRKVASEKGMTAKALIDGDAQLRRGTRPLQRIRRCASSVARLRTA